MSDKPLPAFRSIGAPLDVDDAALDRLNAKLGVPTMTRPTATARTPADRHEAPRAPLEKLTIELPGYLMDALRRTALDGRTTVRHVVMLALKANGFAVAEADIIPDGRRQRQRSR